MKTSTLAAVLVASLGTLAATNGHAVDGTISFDGLIQSTTCDVSAGDPGGGKDYTVHLPNATPSDFTGAGQEFGDTPYSIFVKRGSGGASCPDGTKVKVRYNSSSPLVDATTGNLKLVEGTGDEAGGLEIQVANGNGTPINLATSPESKIVTVSGGQAEVPFIGRYVSIAATVTPGNAKSAVEYTVIYN